MKKWNTAFANLAISYVSIVLVIVLLLCSFFYIYFSGNYKEELRNKNRLILENTAQTIESMVLQRVQQIYLDISLNKTADAGLFADPSFQGNLSKVIDLQELLESEVASNPDIVQAVHLYDPAQQTMLSSLYGLQYHADQGGSASYFMDWINGMRSGRHSSFWTKARWVPDDIFSSLPDQSGNTLITYVHSYPFQSSGDNSDLIIAIDVRVSAVNGILENMMPSQYESTFIVDASGAAIQEPDKGMDNLQDSYGSSITKVLMSEDESGSFNEVIRSTSYVVSYQTLLSTGWTIYSATPALSFYEKMMVIQKLILGICLMALLFGFMLSGILARASYSPIKRLVGKVKELTGPAAQNVTNEFRLIDTAFVRLNDKVGSLEETLQMNSPLIKHKVVMNMLGGCYTREEVAGELEFLRIPRKYAHCCCLILNPGETLARMSSGSMQAVISRMMNQLETAALPESSIIAEELPDKKLVVIICARKASEALVEELSRRILSDAKQHSDLDMQISWGSWVQEMAHIQISYNEARTLMKYGYFLPECSILKDRSLLSREDSLDEIPQTLLTRFREKLHTRQTAEIIPAIEQLVHAIRQGSYPADYCHFVLANTVFVYSDYLKSVRYKPGAQGHVDLYHQYIGIHNIDDFHGWLVESVSLFIAGTENRNSERAHSTMESAKQYIENQLAGDLSLETVAAKVFISPKYLSKLFKEELGVTYTDYVTSRRMEQARLLIENHSMTIEQIASSVGYGTTAYFIKRFKEMHGCTPGNYLRSTVHQM